MITSTIAKNGTINLPVKIRKKLGLKIGDQISYIVTDDGVIIVPVKRLDELAKTQNYTNAVEIIEEITQEHRRERE